MKYRARCVLTPRHEDARGWHTDDTDDTDLHGYDTKRSIVTIVFKLWESNP
jgi:hypothetical protein